MEDVQMLTEFLDNRSPKSLAWMSIVAACATVSLICMSAGYYFEIKVYWLLALATLASFPAVIGYNERDWRVYRSTDNRIFGDYYPDWAHYRVNRTSRQWCERWYRSTLLLSAKVAGPFTAAFIIAKLLGSSFV